MQFPINKSSSCAGYARRRFRLLSQVRLSRYVSEKINTSLYEIERDRRFSGVNRKEYRYEDAETMGSLILLLFYGNYVRSCLDLEILPICTKMVIPHVRIVSV